MTEYESRLRGQHLLKTKKNRASDFPAKMFHYAIIAGVKHQPGRFSINKLKANVFTKLYCSTI